MRLRILAPVAASATVLVLPEPAYPQTLPIYLHRLPAETVVRLQLSTGELLRGRIARSDPATLTLRYIDPQRRDSLADRLLALDSVVRGWTHEGNHWKLGTVLGAGIGVLGVLVAGEITLSTQDGSSCSVGCWLGALGVGAVMGGGVGYLVGHSIPIWREIEPDAH